MNQALSACWLAAVWGPRSNPEKHTGSQQVLTAVRHVKETCNCALQHFVFTAGQRRVERKWISRLFPCIISYLLKCISSASALIAPCRHCLLLPGCATNLEIEFKEWKLEMRAFSFRFISPVKHFWCEAFTRLQGGTPTHLIPFTWWSCRLHPTGGFL